MFLPFLTEEDHNLTCSFNLEVVKAKLIYTNYTHSTSHVKTHTSILLLYLVCACVVYILMPRMKKIISESPVNFMKISLSSRCLFF